MKGPLHNWKSMRSQPVSILGNGVSGKGVLNLLETLKWEGRIYDEKAELFDEKAARESSVVVISPGFQRNHPWIELAVANQTTVLTELDFASCFLFSPIVSITGTNGKTTLTSLLAHLWRKMQRPCVTAGNIGRSLSQVIAEGMEQDSLVFLETSSFQSQMLRYLEPDSALWTNFTEDHLDHHNSQKEYFLAKANLLKRCSGYSWIGESVRAGFEDLKLNPPSKHKVVRRLDDKTVPLPDDHFLMTFPQRENLALAHEFCKSEALDSESFFTMLKDYQGFEHRLRKIAELKGVSFWNDSKATNFAATLSACESIKGTIFWIGGGRSKGGSLISFVESIVQKIEKAFLFGEVGPRVKEIFDKIGFPHEMCLSVEDAVSKAYASVVGPASILFSPGFASFDTHSSYADRGKDFMDIVFDLKNSLHQTTQECLT